jgi:hypothetical protein
MANTTFDIITKSNGTITAAGQTNEWGTIDLGSRQTFRFYFDNPTTRGSIVAHGGETKTVGEDTTVNRIIAEDGGEILIEDGVTVTQERSGLWLLMQYVKWSNKVATGETLDDRLATFYRSHIPSTGVPIASPVVGIRPASDIRDFTIPGFWGAVIGGSDLRNSTLTNWQAEIDLFVLAEYNDYANHTKLEADLEV